MRSTSSKPRILAGAILATTMFVGGTLVATGAQARTAPSFGADTAGPASNGTPKPPPQTIRRLGNVSFTLGDTPYQTSRSSQVAMQQCTKNFGSRVTSVQLVQRHVLEVDDNPPYRFSIIQWTFDCLTTQ